MDGFVSFKCVIGGLSLVGISAVAFAGNVCPPSGASGPNAPRMPVYYRHEYPRSNGGPLNSAAYVRGDGPAVYPSGRPYYYSGGFAPGGFAPNYEYDGGVGGYRLDLRGNFRPDWRFPRVIP